MSTSQGRPRDRAAAPQHVSEEEILKAYKLDILDAPLPRGMEDLLRAGPGPSDASAGPARPGQVVKK